MINTGCSNNRSAEISADVFNGNIRGAEIRLYTNIKPIRVIRVHFIFNFTKRWANTGNKLLKQYFTEGIPKKVIIKMNPRTAGSHSRPAPPAHAPGPHRRLTLLYPNSSKSLKVSSIAVKSILLSDATVKYTSGSKAS